MQSFNITIVPGDPQRVQQIAKRLRARGVPVSFSGATHLICQGRGLDQKDASARVCFFLRGE